MIILTYILATVLLLWSLFILTTHLRPIPTYISWLLKNLFDYMAWRGLLPGAITLGSIYVSIKSYLNPSSYWLKMTLVFIALSIGIYLLTLYWTYRMLKPAYDEYVKEEDKAMERFPKLH
jgi:hypothetical protein